MSRSSPCSSEPLPVWADGFQLDKACSEKLTAADTLQRASRDGAGAAYLAAVEACKAIDRDADVSRATQAANDAKAAEATRKEAARQSGFAAALSEAERQPETDEGAASAVASYKRALELGTLDKMQSAQFANRLRAQGNAMMVKKDYTAAISAFQEAKMRDPDLNLETELRAARAAQHKSGSAKYDKRAIAAPSKGTRDHGSAAGSDADTLSAVDVVYPGTGTDTAPTTGSTHIEHRDGGDAK